MRLGSASSLAALCGGLGGARFALALGERSAATTFITNVGDDWMVGDLLVCPDTDAVLYALAGIFDEERGWGIRDDEFPGPEGHEPPWFGLGVRDRLHHVRRRAALDSGLDLAEATSALAAGLGVSARVVPIASQPNPTRVRTEAGWSAFQEWLVRDRATPQPLEVAWPQAAHARATPEAVHAIRESDVLVVTSSSPIASIEPSLQVPGVRDALVERARAGGRTVLISPIVNGRPPASDRDRHRAHARAALLSACGISPEPVGVARWATEWATDMILDPADDSLAADIEALGVTVRIAPILDQDEASRAALVDAALSAT